MKPHSYVLLIIMLMVVANNVTIVAGNNIMLFIGAGNLKSFLYSEFTVTLSIHALF